MSWRSVSKRREIISKYNRRASGKVESSASNFRNKQSVHLAIGSPIYLDLWRFDRSSTVTTHVAPFKTSAEYFPMITAWQWIKVTTRPLCALIRTLHPVSNICSVQWHTVPCGKREEVKWTNINRQTDVRSPGRCSQNKMSPCAVMEVKRGLRKAEREMVFMASSIQCRLGSNWAGMGFSSSRLSCLFYTLITNGKEGAWYVLSPSISIHFYF